MRIALARGGLRVGVHQGGGQPRYGVGTREEGRRVVYSLHDGHLRRLGGEALNVADHRLDGRPPHD